MKKFYKKNEIVWLKKERTTGKVIQITPKDREVIVKYTKANDTNNTMAEHVEQSFKFWEIDKYRKPLTIKVKYFDKDIQKIEKIQIGDWIDLRSSENITLKQGEFKLIPLGVAMELPRGYEANIVPRSSTYKNFGVLQTNHFAVVDNSYCGDDDQWYMPVVAMRDTEIKRDDRICQFRINRTMPKVAFVEVDTLNNKNRGGHGSTGVR